MTDELQDIIKKLAAAKEGRRGGLSEVAAQSGISSRTIYGLLHDKEPKATVRTVNKLAAYFRKVQRKANAQ